MVNFKLPKDLLLFFTFIILAIILSQRPETKLNPKIERTSNESKINAENRTVVTDTKETIRSLKKASKDFSFVEKRNPFTPDGAYLDLLLPENPYILMAIKKGDPDQALVRNYNGDVMIVKVGDSLIDGYRVIKITDRSIWLERAGKRKELKIFKVEVNKWLVLPKK